MHRSSGIVGAGLIGSLLAITPLCGLAADASIDHAAIIRGWDETTFERGREIYTQSCAHCHGKDGLKTPNPLAAAFAKDPLKNGSDPYSMWQTLTSGYKRMQPQTWLTPTQRYQVIHYIRNAFFKESNRSQYTSIAKEYLAELPTTQGEGGASGSGSMDYGPALTYEIESIRSGLVVRLSSDLNLVYDLHTMAAPSAWTGGYVELEGTHHTEYKGGERGKIAGKRLGIGSFQWGYNGRFEDPRQGQAKHGPIQDELIEYHGHYLHGLNTILSYSVSDRKVLERPGYEGMDDFLAVTHSLHIDAGTARLKLSVGRADNNDATGRYSLKGKRLDSVPGSANRRVLCAGSDPVHMATVVGAPAAAKWKVDKNGRLILTIPPRREPILLKVFRGVSHKRTKALASLKRLVAGTDKIDDPANFVKGGPQRWGRTLETEGELGRGDTAYVLDSLTIPFDNPWGSWMRLTALDFFPDGRCAVSTLNGDVWIISGIDDDLSRLKWKRFATGLYEPLGINVSKGKIYVLGRDRITRLHDLNSDGEADFYENFFGFQHVGAGYHAFTFGLPTDSQGRFYTAKSGRKTDYSIPGAVIRISPDGSTSEVVATGFRHPNGISVGPNDQIYVSDNQGGWIPASKVSHIEKGDFYGYIGWEDNKQPHETFHRPIFWLPQAADNSSGGQVWPTDPRWGPLTETMIHTSYGAGRAFYAFVQNGNNPLQGGVFPFPWHFESGVMRGRVNPQDGQVYLSGQKGWGANVEKDGSLNRIRYTGKPCYWATGSEVTSEGIRLEFEQPLDPESATKTSSFHIARWNYKWSSSYGSPHFRPDTSKAKKKGEEKIKPSNVRLGRNRKTLNLTIPDHKPVDQLKVDYRIKAADGTAIEQTVYWTIKHIPGS